MQGPGCQCRMGRLSVSRTAQRETVCIYRYGDVVMVVDYYAFGWVGLRVRKCRRCGGLSNAQPRDQCIKQTRPLLHGIEHADDAL